MSSCHLCGMSGLVPLLNFGEHPIAHQFVSDLKVQEYVHPVLLDLCERCGLVQLTDPVPPAMLYTEYSWLSAWKPQPHIQGLVNLVDGYLRGDKSARILEVGCNDGTFLAALREARYTNIVGIEPARDAVRAARQKELEVVHDYFSTSSARSLVARYGQFDVLVTRQVLEHVTALQDFRDAMRAAVRIGGYALVEVPNFSFTLATRDYSAIWEEHVNHFTRDTLNRFYTDGGFRLLHDETAPFCGEALITLAQHVGLDSIPRAAAPADHAQALAYRDYWPRYRDAMKRHLQTYRQNGRKVAVYGAGCRACCLINYAGLGPYIEAVLDDQPEKQGKYLPGSRLPILAGAKLEENHYDLCLLAVNAENEAKVMAKHGLYEQAGGLFESLLPPSDRLPRLAT